jgi:hypothetical protein
MEIGEVVEYTGCEDACSQWKSQRQVSDDADQAEASAQAAYDSARTALLWALAAAVALFAAAVAALNIPVVGQYVASALFAAAAVAAAIAAVLAGQLSAAGTDLAEKGRVAEQARGAEAEARGMVNAKCSAAQARDCLRNPLDPSAGFV